MSFVPTVFSTKSSASLAEEVKTELEAEDKSLKEVIDETATNREGSSGGDQQGREESGEQV